MLPMGKSIISMAIFNGKLLNNEKNNWFTHYMDYYWVSGFSHSYLLNGDFP